MHKSITRIQKVYIAMSRQQNNNSFYYFTLELIILQTIHSVQDTAESTATTLTSARGVISANGTILNNIKTIKVNLLELTTTSPKKMLVSSSFHYRKGRREDGKMSLVWVQWKIISRNENFLCGNILILK